MIVTVRYMHMNSGENKDVNCRAKKCFHQGFEVSNTGSVLAVGQTSTGSAHRSTLTHDILIVLWYWEGGRGGTIEEAEEEKKKMRGLGRGREVLSSTSSNLGGRWLMGWGSRLRENHIKRAGVQAVFQPMDFTSTKIRMRSSNVNVGRWILEYLELKQHLWCICPKAVISVYISSLETGISSAQMQFSHVALLGEEV